MSPSPVMGEASLWYAFQKLFDEGMLLLPNSGKVGKRLQKFVSRSTVILAAVSPGALSSYPKITIRPDTIECAIHGGRWRFDL